jgi:hypothetical protein
VGEAELRRLGELRAELRPAVEAALDRQPRLTTHGRWATLPRHELREALELPDEVLEGLPPSSAPRRTVDVAALEGARADAR